MQQNYEKWFEGYSRTRSNMVRTPVTYTEPPQGVYEGTFTFNFDIHTDIGGVRSDVETTLKKKQQHPLANQIASIVDATQNLSNTDTKKDNVRIQTTQVLLRSLFLLSQDIPVDQVGPQAKALAADVAALSSMLEVPQKKLNTISDELVKLGTPKQATPIPEGFQTYVDREYLEDEKSKEETKENWAVAGAVGSGLGLGGGSVIAAGIIFGLGLVTGPAAPIVWGVLGAIAAVGLVGTIIFSAIASKLDDKITALEDRIDDLEGPEGKPYREVNLVTDLNKSREENLSDKLIEAMVAVEELKHKEITSLYSELKDKDSANVKQVGEALGKRMNDDHSQDEFLVAQIQKQHPELSSDAIEMRLQKITEIFQVANILRDEKLAGPRVRYAEGEATIPDKQLLVQTIKAVHDGLAQIEQKYSSAVPAAAPSPQHLPS